MGSFSRPSGRETGARGIHHPEHELDGREHAREEEGEGGDPLVEALDARGLGQLGARGEQPQKEERWRHEEGVGEQTGHTDILLRDPRHDDDEAGENRRRIHGIKEGCLTDG